MQTKQRLQRPGRKARAGEAEASLGPVGNLFGSPAVARLLIVFLQDPDTRLTLSEVRERSGKRAKGTVQSGLRTLMASRLVRREGRGNRTFYRYAADREVGQRMLALIEASQHEVKAVESSDIPWLEGMMRAAPRSPITQPFGGRVEQVPSSEGAERILAANQPVEGAGQPRTRPGLRTRA